MLSFRKMLWAFALMAVCMTIASAQTQPFQCTANAGVPPAARLEGYAEEMGQVVIICTGGTPTPLGQLVPTVNIQIFLNTFITSKIMSDPWTEALLLIDEPLPANQKVCGDAGTSYNSSTGTCLVKAASGIGYGPAGGLISGTYDGQAEDLTSAYHQSGHPNVFQARCTQASCATSPNPASIVWLGVPIDPPGTTGQRVIRLTNIRANATGSPVSGTLLPSAIYMVISISGTGSLPVTQQALTVAIVQPGMKFSASPTGINFLQCVKQTSLCPNFKLVYQELFGTAFRKQQYNGLGVINSATATSPGTSVDQNQPGFIYNTEGMFYGTNLPDLTGISRGNLGHATTGAGRASQGTRLIARFDKVPANVTLYVTARNSNPYASSVVGNNALVTTTTTSAGDGPFTVPSFSSSLVTPTDCSTVGGAGLKNTSFQLYKVPLTTSGGVQAGQVTWEVLEADPGQIAAMEFGVVVNYGSSPLPDLGQAIVYGNYAPTSANQNTMQSTSVPVPRFQENLQSSATFSIISCRTDLLFPFISNQSGFDTGIVIANTSASPFEDVAPRQTGKCQLWYYGTFQGDATKVSDWQITSSNIAAGASAVALLSTGGSHGIVAKAGFQGYLIAQCDFQYAHGFAYISPMNAPLSGGATGYVALVMDANTSDFPRTKVQSETLGN